MAKPRFAADVWASYTPSADPRERVRAALGCLDALGAEEALARFPGFAELPAYLAALPPMTPQQRQASVVGAFTRPASSYKPIRPMTAADRPQAEAGLSALQDHLIALAPTLKPGPEMAAGYLAHLERECAKHDGCLYLIDDIGLVCVWVEHDFEVLETRLNDVAYVSDLVVYPGLRGGGWGRVLLTAAEEHGYLAGVDHVQLTVLAANEGARDVYRRGGYEDVRLLVRKTL